MISKYQPKGGMCKTCIKRAELCNYLPFNTMPVIEKYREYEVTISVVRCTEFERGKATNA